MDPFTFVFLLCLTIGFLVSDGIDGVASARGNTPHRSNNRHEERMQRMRHGHEKWMARHAALREQRAQGGMIRQALQRRIAEWVANAGRRATRADEVRIEREDDDVRRGRTPGVWRLAWRNARQWWAHKRHQIVSRAARRFASRPRVVTTDNDSLRVDTETAAPARPLIRVPAIRADQPKAIEAAPIEITTTE